MKGFAAGIVIALVLWTRQLRYERRLSNRQGRWEREAERALRYRLDEQDRATRRFSEEVNESFEIFVKADTRLRKEINKALGEARR